MKRFLPLVFAAGTLMFFGCGSNNPDQVALDHVKSGLEFDSTISVDTGNLTSTVTHATDEKATVEVAGTVDVSGEYTLIKENDKWVIKK